MDLIRDELSTAIIETARQLAREKNVGKITVRDILKEMKLTNRVFYNRFHNIDEVFEILYTESINKVRESVAIPWKEGTDFGAHVVYVAARTLSLTYESRPDLGHYVFQADSFSDNNYEWWSREIRQLIAEGKKIGYLKKDLDEDSISYAIWCFIRGFNTDALARNIPEEEAVRQFRYGFGCLMDGMKA